MADTCLNSGAHRLPSGLFCNLRTLTLGKYNILCCWRLLVCTLPPTEIIVSLMTSLIYYCLMTISKGELTNRSSFSDPFFLPSKPLAVLCSRAHTALSYMFQCPLLSVLHGSHCIIFSSVCLWCHF